MGRGGPPSLREMPTDIVHKFRSLLVEIREHLVDSQKNWFGECYLPLVMVV